LRTVLGTRITGRLLPPSCELEGYIGTEHWETMVDSGSVTTTEVQEQAGVNRGHAQVLYDRCHGHAAFTNQVEGKLTQVFQLHKS